jgi:ATP-binding cassette, subfamily B, bacterial PglK
LAGKVNSSWNINSHNVKSARAGEFLTTQQLLPRLWLELLSVVGLASLVLIMVAQGRNTSSIVPTLALFGAAAFRLMPSVNRVVSSVHSLRYCSPVIELLAHELALPVTETIAPGDRLTADFQTTISLSHVGYTYSGAATPALTDITVRIERGEYVGFIGPSGSGKTTLVDVLLGLLPASSGQVTVDGHDIRENVRWWQSQIGYIPQSIFLTDDTVRRNVAFGLANDQIDDTAVGRAIEAAQLEEFVAGLRDGVETVVGERGVRLSGGQRQRIGIARALYNDPAILVMDEATSALDSVTEAGVMQAVTAMQRSKTILVVAHRTSTVERCDRVFRLERGRLVAEGPPVEQLHSRKAV